MNIVMPLTEFLELETYNQLLPWVDLPLNVCEHIRNGEAEYLARLYYQGIAPTYIPCYYIESINHEVSRVWYPMKSWIEELKRREAYNNTLTEVQKQVEHDRNIVRLRAELIDAIGRDDTVAMSRITLELNKLKEQKEHNG